jgi:2-keto-4-pentenoate hydratase/2-oxohepta-3-ene-1,7-dioic acid hydratase in catechol pathway
MASFRHLIRFLATAGQVYFANLDHPDNATQYPLQVTGFESFDDLLSNQGGRPVTVARLLAPVPYNGDIICIGINYRAHAEESNVCYLG